MGKRKGRTTSAIAPAGRLEWHYIDYIRTVGDCSPTVSTFTTFMTRGVESQTREMRTMNDEPKAERSRGLDERKIYEDGVPENDLDEFQFK